MSRKAILDRARKLLLKKPADAHIGSRIVIVPPGQDHVPVENALTIYLQAEEKS